MVTVYALNWGISGPYILGSLYTLTASSNRVNRAGIQIQETFMQSQLMASYFVTKGSEYSEAKGQLAKHSLGIQVPVLEFQFWITSRHYREDK